LNVYLTSMQAGKNIREDLQRKFSLDFSDHHFSTSLLPRHGEFAAFSEIFVEYQGVIKYLIGLFIVNGFFFMVREYFRWDTFVIRSPVVAYVVVIARIAAIILLIVTVYPYTKLNPAAAALGGISCAIAILIPVAILMSNLPRGRLSSLFSYACRVLSSAIVVPFVWHILFVEKIINPIAGPVFTDSTPSSMMICFWFVGSLVGLTLHGHMDKQVKKSEKCHAFHSPYLSQILFLGVTHGTRH